MKREGGVFIITYYQWISGYQILKYRVVGYNNYLYIQQ